MGTHYSNFTSQQMIRLSDELQAGEDARRDFCRSNQDWTRDLMARFHSERHAAAQARARALSQFIRDLRAERQRLRERSHASAAELAEMSQQRAEEARELARESQATIAAFRDAQRARRMRADDRPMGGAGTSRHDGEEG